MRRMTTNKGVVEVVNQAIEDGEIEIEGGLPSFDSENIGQFLSVAEVASEPALVWSDVDALPEIQVGDAGKVLKVNEQEDGVEWGEGSSGSNSLVLDLEGAANKEISEEIYNNINSKAYDYIIIKNYSGLDKDVFFSLQLLGSSTSSYGSLTDFAYTTSNTLKSLSYGIYKINLTTSPYKISINKTTNAVPICKRVLLTGASGTFSDKPKNTYPENLIFLYQPSAGNVCSTIIWETFDSGSPNWGIGYATVYASESDTSPVKYKITYSGNNWTATAV